MKPNYEEIEAKIALLEVQLKLSEAAERAWESSMMQACGEDGPKSVADKFAELESKLETALRECRSAGVTIDNLEAKCAALAAENAALKAAHPQPFGPEMMNALDAEPVTTACKLPDDFICMLTGRAKYLREKGEIKSPEILERAADALHGVSVNTTSISNGWKLVPIDPTKDMLRAGQSVVGFWLNTVHCYSKMLAAAPAAPQQEDL